MPTRIFPAYYELAPWAEEIADPGSDVVVDGFDELLALEAMDDRTLEECCKIVRNLELYESAARAESKRLAELAKSAADRAEKVKERMKAAMTRLGDTKRQVSDLFNVAIQKSPEAVEVVDLNLVPTVYDKPVERQVDKSKVKEALKAGAWIPGVELRQGTHVRIR